MDKFYKFFKKNQSRNFVNFLIKERDEFFKNAFLTAFESFFGDFAPDLNKLPISIIASGRYAQNLISTNSTLEILIIYKEIKGYNLKPFLKDLEQKFLEFNGDLKVKSVEISQIFSHFSSDFKLKSSVSIVRYICGSKVLYRTSKDEFLRLKELEKTQFLTQHLKIFYPFNNVPYLEQEPDLNKSYGGVDEIFALNCILSTISGENQARLSIQNLLNEKEISQFNLSLDFLLSLKSVVNLVNNESVFSEKNIDEMTDLMQTKSKKAQDTNVRISQKILASMRNLGLFARFLVACLLRPAKSDFSFLARKTARKNGFYIIDATIYTPLHKKLMSLSELLVELNALNDISYKFDISTIFYFKRTNTDGFDASKSADEIKKLLARNNAYTTLEALLDAEILGIIIKPMENILKLAKYDGYHKFSVDEHSVLSVYYLENIKDKFIKSLYSQLCVEGKAMLKLATLMHDVGKGVEGDHSVVGANIFRAYANRLEFSSNAVNIGVLLVRYHILMSDVANQEDIYSERTIFSFISKLGDKKVLELLYIMTYCVINATSDGLYTAYTARLLRKLFDISYESFSDQTLLDEATRRSKKEHSIKRHDDFERLDENIKDKIFKISSNLLFAKHAVSDIIAITKQAYECKNLELNIQNTQALSVKIISAHEINLPALLAVLAGFDLAYMEIYELFDEKFFIRLEFNKNAKTNEILSLKAKAINALNSDEKAQILKPIISKDEVSFDLNHSDEYARLNINAKDQRGLMAYVMSVFKSANFKIVSAKVQTIKNRTRNLFLISKNDELCYNHAQILNQIISE
ncbi:HD domain-containing protein [Campylobacter gastrosuis]|uniref:HD domain-containing protein n=1 Tax=Campylobacter gastrosuis TaxID=2974576 RepID=A0ABT7HS66_9BACT|nr:HD domain-containing protein [Campylobacter gastrosuis]MDL0089258.1 HD domain-containing protein [Campylobacter gastrosuis]